MRIWLWFFVHTLYNPEEQPGDCPLYFAEVESASVEVILNRFSLTKRKDSSTPTEQILVGSCPLSVNPTAGSHPATATVLCLPPGSLCSKRAPPLSPPSGGDKHLPVLVFRVTKLSAASGDETGNEVFY